MLKSGMAAIAAVGALLAGCYPAENAKQPQPVAPAGWSDAALATAVRAKVESDGRCILAEEHQPAWTIGFDIDGQKMFTTDCSSGPAGKSEQLYLVRPDASLIAIPFVIYNDQGDPRWRSEDIVPNLSYESRTKEFSATNRRTADSYGWEGRWRWNGHRPVLIEMKTVCCETEHAVEAVIWPTTPATSEPTPAPVSESD
jgi:hypothetical protein